MNPLESLYKNFNSKESAMKKDIKESLQLSIEQKLGKKVKINNKDLKSISDLSGLDKEIKYWEVCYKYALEYDCSTDILDNIYDNCNNVKEKRLSLVTEHSNYMKSTTFTINVPANLDESYYMDIQGIKWSQSVNYTNYYNVQDTQQYSSSQQVNSLGIEGSLGNTLGSNWSEAQYQIDQQSHISQLQQTYYPTVYRGYTAKQLDDLIDGKKKHTIVEEITIVRGRKFKE